MTKIISEEYSFGDHNMMSSFKGLIDTSDELIFVAQKAGSHAPIYHLKNSTVIINYSRGNLSLTGNEDAIRESKNTIEEKLGVELKKI